MSGIRDGGGNAAVSDRRKCYSREETLKQVVFYHANQKNMYRTGKCFCLISKTAMRWVKDEEKSGASKQGSKRMNFSGSSDHPQVEAQLYQEYTKLEARN